MSWKVAALAALVTVTGGCATGGKARGGAQTGFGDAEMGEASGTLFIEPSIRPGEVRISRVAIVPNRLPANLRDPEKWRKTNWGLIEKEFRARRFDVVDYQTSVEAFERSGLPVEDTRSSRDKYAELAAALGVDAVIIPYYGALHYMNMVFMVAEQHFVSVLTFQVYYTAKNDFGGRIDASGEVEYKTGEIMVSSLITGLTLSLLGASGLGAEESCQTIGGQRICTPGQSPLGTIGSITMGVGSIVDLIDAVVKSSRGGDYYWEQAFAAAVRKGLEPWFAAYSAGGGGAAPPPRAVPMPPPPSYAPPPPSYAPPPPVSGGCQSNADCKAGRVCVQGACTSPR